MTEPDANVVLYERRDAVAIVTLNRPDRLNAWTPQIETEYFDALARAADDNDVRAIVVTGAGRGFCAGADMNYLQGIETGDRGGRSGPQRPQTFPLTIPKPLIAAVNGPCAGIGMVHALMCDLRFAAAGAKFTTAFARRGLVAEHGMSWLLPRLVGQAHALDLLYSARVVLAEEALTMGLVNKVVDPAQLMDETLAYATELATWSSPASMAAMKFQVYRHADSDLATALADSNKLMAKSLRGGDFREGVASFVDKREPKFEPLDDPPRLG